MITTTEFLEQVKTEALIPTNQTRFTAANIYSLADQETRVRILPMLLSIGQEFLVKKIAMACVANQAEYKIPARFVGRTLRDIKLTGGTGTGERELPFIAPEDTQDYTLNNTTGEPSAFTIRGEYVVLLPTPDSANYTLNLYGELLPGKLVASDEASTIAGINTTTGVVTISEAVSTFATGQRMDIIDHEVGNSVLGQDLLNSNVSGTAVTFTASDLPATAAVGNYLARAGETPVVQLPLEVTDCLVTATARRILILQGDTEGAKALKELLDEKMKAITKLFTPRVQSQAPTIIQNNGLLRRSYSNLFRARYTP